MNVRAPLISVRWIHRALNAADLVGADTRAVRRIVLPATPTHDETLMISRDLYLETWERLVSENDDPTLPLRAGLAARMETDDLLAFGCATARTLREGIDLLMSFIASWTEDVVFRLEPEDDGAHVLSTARLTPTTRLGARLADEFLIADLLSGGRWLTGVAFRPVEVRFLHGPPADTRGHATTFGAPVRFSAERTALVLSAETLALPLPRHDPWVAGFARATLRQYSDRQRERGERAGFRTLVGQRIVGSFGRAVPTLEAVAMQLGVSPRTLRRRLRDESTSFRDLLDDARRITATDMVRESDRPIADVAAALGFAQLSSFHRAFVRWNGAGPARFRSQPPGAPEGDALARDI